MKNTATYLLLTLLLHILIFDWLRHYKYNLLSYTHKLLFANIYITNVQVDLKVSSHITQTSNVTAIAKVRSASFGLVIERRH